MFHQFPVSKKVPPSPNNRTVWAQTNNLRSGSDDFDNVLTKVTTLSPYGLYF